MRQYPSCFVVMYVAYHIICVSYSDNCIHFVSWENVQCIVAGLTLVNASLVLPEKFLGCHSDIALKITIPADMFT